MIQVFNTQSMLQLKLDTGISLDGATVKKILYKKPGGAGSGAWEVTVTDGTKLVYNLTDSDIDVTGDWYIQAFVTIGGKDGYGKIVKQNFSQKLHP